MSVFDTSIIIEDKFAEMFGLIPDIVVGAVNYEVVFRYGDKYELVAFLKSEQGLKKSPYPLIWLVWPYDEEQKKTRVELEDMTIVLAVQNLNPAMLNNERLELTFRPLLYPLLDTIKRLFLRSNTISINDDVYNVRKYPNYGADTNFEDGNESEATDFWDALKIDFSCSLNNKCLKLKSI